MIRAFQTSQSCPSSLHSAACEYTLFDLLLSSGSCLPSESPAEFPQVKAASLTVFAKSCRAREFSMPMRQRTRLSSFRKLNKKFVPNLAAAFFHEGAT